MNEENEIETNPQNGMSALTRIVVDGLISGMQFDELAEENNIPVVEVVRTWRGYLNNQQKMSREEQWALHLLRLEAFLTKLHNRLTNSSKAEDYELVLKMLDKLEAMHALNETRKVAAEEVVMTLSEQQGKLIAMMLATFSAGLVEQVNQIVEQGKTLKGIKTKLEEMTGDIVDEQISLALGVIDDA